jgi:hypothetical protein
MGSSSGKQPGKQPGKQAGSAPEDQGHPGAVQRVRRQACQQRRSRHTRRLERLPLLLWHCVGWQQQGEQVECAAVRGGAPGAGRGARQRVQQAQRQHE